MKDRDDNVIHVVFGGDGGYRIVEPAPEPEPEPAREDRRVTAEPRSDDPLADLYDGVEGRFDMILTNPPYVDAVDLAALPPEYAHEPVLALDGGGDGLDLMRRILAGAPARLAPGGILVGEVGASAAALCRSVPALPFVWVDLEDGGDGVFVLDAEAFDTKT